MEKVRIWWDYMNADYGFPWALSIGCAGEEFEYLDGYPTWQQAVDAANSIVELLTREKF